MTYRRYGNHWVVVCQDGSIYCHCDTIEECKEEINNCETIKERIL